MAEPVILDPMSATPRHARDRVRRLRLAVISRPRLWDVAVIAGCSLVAAAVIFGVLYDAADGALRRWSDRDLERRGALVSVAFASAEGAAPSLDRLLTTLSSNPDAANIAVCGSGNALLAASGIATAIACDSELAQRALAARDRTIRGTVDGRSAAVTAHGIARGRSLLVVQDRTFVDARRQHLLRIVGAGAELAFIALLLVARAGTRIGGRRAEEEARSVVRDFRSTDAPVPPHLRLLVRDMEETVERLRLQESAPPTGPERLRALACSVVRDGNLVVIANREPYAHQRDRSGNVTVERPASGLVTGIEPILRACGGTWIAYGGGSADRECSDAQGRVSVPPESPEYTLRRLFIEEDCYERYYSGFANEALWPLCHTAHAQPVFRSEDWASYQEVNERFARAATEESGADGLLLIQDYHFALVPRLVRERAPHLLTSIFWHIPWPNAEVFGICPWKEAILDGMCGADILGFHTRQYCLNFLETAQRYLECRVDFEEMTVTVGGHTTRVREYPISVEWPYPAAARSAGIPLRARLGIAPGVHVCLGVDRADYTKGLLERVAAIEELLAQNASLRGRFVFVQLASPTRMRIVRYQQLADDLAEAVVRVNARYGTAEWQPIVLQSRTFAPDEVREYYAMANSALVTPLHDGMNLVAKEYVGACADGDGALVLSVFAGAAKELSGALLVNPYDTQQVADAILRAVRMPAAERRARMQSMRAHIAEHSIYRWSESLLMDMHEARQGAERYWPQHGGSARNVRQVAAG